MRRKSSARGRATARESGWSDETEEGFYDTVAFIDGAEALCVITSLIVHPGSRSHRRGSITVRARRFFQAFEHFHSIIKIESSLPTNIAVQIMLDQAPDAF